MAHIAGSNTLRYLVPCLLLLAACYKQEENIVHYEDGISTVIYDLPGDTLASDGWESAYEPGDTYLRQHFFNASWTDSIRIVPWNNEKINAAQGIDANGEASITWLSPQASHPSEINENTAYTNTQDGQDYIFRSGVWYQMSIPAYTAANDSQYVNWLGSARMPPAKPEKNWAYCDLDNQRVYVYSGTAWVLAVNFANYRSNIKFIQVQYSRSGKETGTYNMFLFRFKDKQQYYIRDGADSARYLKTADWDIAFTGNFNSIIWLNNSTYDKNPGYGGPLNRSAIVMYEYGYDFMNEAPADSVFDAVIPQNNQVGYSSEFGAGINAWYEYSTTTHVAQPFPYRAYYLRLQQPDGSFKYGKLQLISMYKGAPDVVTDLNWPSPYFTFRYYIQEDGSRNLKTSR